MRLKDLHPKTFFIDAWHFIDAEAAELRKENGGKRDPFMVLYIFVVAAIALTLSDLDYLGGEVATDTLFRFIDNPISSQDHPVYWFFVGWMKPASGLLRGSYYAELMELGYWTTVKVLAYLVIPVLAILIHPRLHLRQIGLSTKGFKEHLGIYAMLFVPVLIAVVVVSFTDDFSTYYPFYIYSTRSPFDFWAWEIMYILQFFSLEFFFRGFLLQPLKRELGSSAIFAMILPYVMIHYGKPFSECFGAILAGVVLGTLAMRTRSIWAGFLIHVSVALSMDIAANLQNNGLSWLKSLFLL